MTRAALLAFVDMRSLARTRGTAVLLFLYPLGVALLLGLILVNQSEPRIALVNEDPTSKPVVIGDKTFDIDTYRDQAEAAGVDIVDMNGEEADRALDEGQVAGILKLPSGATAKLATQISPTKLELHTGDSPLGNTIAQRVRGVVSKINLKISDALIETNAGYLDTLVTGGDVEVAGDTYTLTGLANTQEKLEALKEELPAGTDTEAIDDAIEFASDATAALGLAEGAMQATAAPIRLEHVRTKGKSPLLSAQALAFALSVLCGLTCIVMAATSLAAERRDRVLDRLLQGIVSSRQVVIGKALFGALLALTLSLGLLIAFAILAPPDWARVPLLLADIAIAGIAAAAVGTLVATLVRDARVATLAALLVAAPFVPLMLVPGSDVASIVSMAMPLEPARELFNATLFDVDPWSTVAQNVAHLGAIALIAGGISSVLLDRRG
jgi:ABC-type Na+ efflux pump permease subunit